MESRVLRGLAVYSALLTSLLQYFGMVIWNDRELRGMEGATSLANQLQIENLKRENVAGVTLRMDGLGLRV